MHSAWFLLVWTIAYTVHLASTKPVDLHICSSVYSKCKCGQSDVVFDKEIKQCSAFHRWKMRCKPCKDTSEEELCGAYRNCLHCYPDGRNRCASCPLGRFGQWCQNECTCQNGAVCESDGKCTCKDGFEGRNCEIQKGCEPFASPSPTLKVELTPPHRPITAVYSCLADYELRGSAVSTCVTGNKWSSPPPVCLLKCPLLSTPANGRLIFSKNELTEGVTAEVLCHQNHRLVGEKKLTCLSDGRWSGEPPLCEKMAFCPNPGNVQHANRIVLSDSVQSGSRFIEDSIIQYKCLEGFEQLGGETIVCRFNGTWSDSPPNCVKVSTVFTNCFTKGSQIVSEEGDSVRIFCPPECADEEFKVWGTSIYRQGSYVCQAAIHSAKITNSGGPVAVINNGDYSHFTGSHSNNIESESFSGRDESFRFDKLPPVSSADIKTCDKSLIQMDNVCVYISNTLRTQKEASAICSNLGLRLEMLKVPEQREKLISTLNIKNINSIWMKDQEKSPMLSNFSSAFTNNSGEDSLCSVAVIHNLNFEKENRNCSDNCNFICIRNVEDIPLASCSDPGPIVNGTAKPVGQIDGVFYVGSSIEFSCNSLHYLRGVDEIACLSNGTWSDPKPVCIKVNACEDPPVPIGGFVTYLAPSPTQRTAMIPRPGMAMNAGRLARFPSGLSSNFTDIPPPPAATPAPEPETVSLPPGLHRVGSRAMYDCESRYYNLIGSRTRRCEGQGQWSGRPPTCIPVCGRSDSPKLPFIVNSNATDIGQWPWQAGIARFLPDYDRWFLLCGGSLLNERWVITAAHCLTYAGTILSVEPDKFQVYLGKYHRMDSKDDEYVQVRKIIEIHIHPDYDPLLYDSDIALLQLDSPVQLNSRVQPVCLPNEQTTKENLVEGKKGVVTGWGMDENSTYSETLRQAALPVVSRENCEKGYEESELPLTVTENMFCAGFKQGRTDACSGDSGGPVVFLDPTSRERKWVLEGIVSWGSPQGCGNPNQYGGFTTVSRFLDWIHLYF